VTLLFDQNLSPRLSRAVPALQERNVHAVLGMAIDTGKLKLEELAAISGV
jgi:hypothetical protein